MFSRILWLDEVRDPDHTYKVTDNKDGTMTAVRAGRQIQAGTNQNAANFNRLEQGVLDNSAALDALMTYVFMKLGHSKHSIDSLESLLKTSFYATSDTEAGTAAKVASSVNGDFVLATGARVAVRFAHGNTHASPTLNVDGKGAKSIRSALRGATPLWAPGAVMELVYDGSAFCPVSNGTEADHYQLTAAVQQNTVSGEWRDRAIEQRVTDLEKKVTELAGKIQE